MIGRRSCHFLALFTTGDLPVKAQQLVKEWLKENQDKPIEMWDTQKLEKLPPL